MHSCKACRHPSLPPTHVFLKKKTHKTVITQEALSIIVWFGKKSMRKQKPRSSNSPTHVSLLQAAQPQSSWAEIRSWVWKNRLLSLHHILRKLLQLLLLWLSFFQTLIILSSRKINYTEFQKSKQVTHSLKLLLLIGWHYLQHHKVIEKTLVDIKMLTFGHGGSV